MHNNSPSHLAEIASAIQFSIQTGAWVVLLFPSREALTEANKVLPSMLPPMSCVMGRTSWLPEQGRISLAKVQDEIFVPKGQPFTLTFLNWLGATTEQYEATNVWRQRAERVRHP